MNFSLDDIGEILALRERGEAPCLYVSGLVEDRIAEIDAKMAALHQLRRELDELHTEAAALPPRVLAAKGCVCHIIENRRLEAES